MRLREQKLSLQLFDFALVLVWGFLFGFWGIFLVGWFSLFWVFVCLDFLCCFHLLVGVSLF